ncbi:hypothetical protein LTR84_004781 [Exophiala bonariae]|uniref:Methyltransferase type 11 domain-containing protein n=1 Tax=Exophiala bonariae TaxID=1690606 RepID=A0AAV9NNB5_9EURO|nr:hypothetical protein LTR84_004781 [Exophiala bonariae]
MTMTESSLSSAIAKSALEFWDANAPVWDDVMREDGNDYWTVLEMPALQRMAEVKPGDSALDLATGNGLVARWLVENGASTVSATDGSSAMLQYAIKRTSDWATARGPQHEDSITFKTLNVVDRDQVNLFVQEVSEYKPAGFDVITMNMAIMDIPDLVPLAHLISVVLKAHSGRFIATILHPLFFTSGASRHIEASEDSEGNRVIDRSIVVRQYLDVPPRKIAPITSDQPARQIAFHRPMHQLLAPFFAAGLVMDRLEEPNFDESFIDKVKPYASKNYSQLPKILAFRLRRI